MLRGPRRASNLTRRALAAASLIAPLAGVAVLGLGSTWAAGCGSDDEPAGAAGSAGTAGTAGDSGDDEDAGFGGSAGTDASVDAVADAAPEAATLGQSCDSVLCADGLFCSEDPCTEEFCPQTCKKEVPSCSAQPAPCAAGLVCVTKVEFPTMRSYCIPAAKAGAPCDPTTWETCEEGYFCGRDTGDGGDPFTRLCQKRSAEGQACKVENGSCADGFRCQNEICTARKPAGSDCVGSSECLEEHFCSQDTGTCEAAHPVGGPCRAANAVCSGSDCLYFSDYCAAGLICDKAGDAGCFHDTNCSGNEQFCCVPGADADAGADAQPPADASNVGQCSTDFKCLRPIGVCSAPPSP